MEGEGERDKDPPLPEELKRPHRAGVFPSAWLQYPLAGSYWVLLVLQALEMLQCLLVAYSAVIF